MKHQGLAVSHKNKRCTTSNASTRFRSIFLQDLSLVEVADQTTATVGVDTSKLQPPSSPLSIHLSPRPARVGELDGCAILLPNSAPIFCFFQASSESALSATHLKEARTARPGGEEWCWVSTDTAEASGGDSAGDVAASAPVACRLARIGAELAWAFCQTELGGICLRHLQFYMQARHLHSPQNSEHSFSSERENSEHWLE